MMDKHQNFICHVTPIQNVKMVSLYVYIRYTQVHVNKRTALRGGPLDTAGGGGGSLKKSLFSRWCRY